MADIIICGHGSGTPSTKRMESYLESRYNQFAPNRVRKGLVSVKRLKQEKDGNRFHDLYQTLLGRNTYSQSLRQYVYTPYGGQYYSDCSSSICATYQQQGYDVPLLNTAGIYQSGLFESVPVAISGGQILNPQVLKVGDCLLFAGDNPKRPKQIGHVEAIYLIPSIAPEYPIEGTVTVSTDLNIREFPSKESKVVGVYGSGEIVTVTSKSGEWFRTNKGWISRKFVVGWIKEPQTDPYKNYWYIENGRYPIGCVKKIGGEDYVFDNDGWMVERERISPTGAIIY